MSRDGKMSARAMAAARDGSVEAFNASVYVLADALAMHNGNDEASLRLADRARVAGRDFPTAMVDNAAPWLLRYNKVIIAANSGEIGAIHDFFASPGLVADTQDADADVQGLIGRVAAIAQSLDDESQRQYAALVAALLDSAITYTRMCRGLAK